MTPRTLAAAALLAAQLTAQLAALLAAGCFVDNRPGASASGATDTAPTTSTTRSDTGEPSTGPGDTTGAVTSGVAGTTDTPTSGSTTTSASSTSSTTTTTGSATATTTAGDTTGPDPPAECPAVDQLGGAASPEACAACVSAECCELFTMCAQSAPCKTAWACISDEPCAGAWPACPGVLQSLQVLTDISNCMKGPCAEVCPTSCGLPEANCTANPECTALDACIDTCLPNCGQDDACIATCVDDCTQAHAAGADDWQALFACQTKQCG